MTWQLRSFQSLLLILLKLITKKILNVFDFYAFLFLIITIILKRLSLELTFRYLDIAYLCAHLTPVKSYSSVFKCTICSLLGISDYLKTLTPGRHGNCFTRLDQRRQCAIFKSFGSKQPSAGIAVALLYHSSADEAYTKEREPLTPSVSH